jgi:hypothetical protein
MGVADINDDSLTRYVVKHYAFDATRHERRHQVVVVFDNADEFEASLEELADGLRRRRDVGEAIDPREHYTGSVKQPGSDHRRQLVRIVKNAMKHGVVPSDELLAGTTGAEGFAFFRSRNPD